MQQKLSTINRSLPGSPPKKGFLKNLQPDSSANSSVNVVEDESLHSSTSQLRLLFPGPGLAEPVEGNMETLAYIIRLVNYVDSHSNSSNFNLIPMKLARSFRDSLR